MLVNTFIFCSGVVWKVSSEVVEIGSARWVCLATQFKHNQNYRRWYVLLVRAVRKLALPLERKPASGA
jgi:hypothetical protein